MNDGFLPVSRKEMNERGWDQVDFVYISGDAYVDHPSFWSCHHHKAAGIPWLQSGNHCTAGLEDT